MPLKYFDVNVYSGTKTVFIYLTPCNLTEIFGQFSRALRKTNLVKLQRLLFYMRRVRKRLKKTRKSNSPNKVQRKSRWNLWVFPEIQTFYVLDNKSYLSNREDHIYLIFSLTKEGKSHYFIFHRTF